MTTEEIKEQVPMQEVMQRYGVQVRRNMCRCPFHGRDNHPSMKVYKDSAYCFACGWNGDIFKFVQEIANLSFKDAYLELGGSYQKHSDASKKLLELKRTRAKEALAEKKRKEKEVGNMILGSLNILLATIRIYRPVDPAEDFSQEWADAQNELPIILELWEQQYEGEVNEQYVAEKYQRIRERFVMQY